MIAANPGVELVTDRQGRDEATRVGHANDVPGQRRRA